MEGFYYVLGINFREPRQNPPAWSHTEAGAEDCPAGCEADITGRCCLPELDGQGELSEVSQPDLASPALRPELVGLGVLQLSSPLVPVELQQVLPPRRTSSGPFRGISYSGIQPSSNQYHSSEIG